MTAADPLVTLCALRLRQGSKSFDEAARLFEPRVRDAACLLYAWCRHCDDVIDGESLGRERRDPGSDERAVRLAQLREQTRRALRGEAMDDPVFSAFARLVREHGLPERYPLELLEGFAMDVEGRRYAGLDDVLLYCYHVAGTVGLMMAHVMNARDERSRQRAADLGIALQLTNIARDVVDDAQAGRVYLPLAWLASAGVGPDEVADPRHRAAVADVVARLLGEADRFYASGDQGLSRLPWRSAWAVAAARGIYWEIGARVRARGARAWDRRVVVPRRAKLAWIVRAFARAGAAQVLPERAFGAGRPALWRKDASAP